MNLLVKAITIVLMTMCISCTTYDERDLNFSFEHVDDKSDNALNWRYIYEWSLNSTIDTKESFDGNRSLKITSNRNIDYPGYLYHIIDDVKAGQHIEFSGYIKTQNTSSDSLGIFISCSNTEEQIFKVLKNSDLRGTNDWQKYIVELDSIKRTDNLQVGVILYGTGTIWVDNLELRVDDKTVESLSSNYDFKASNAELEWLRNNCEQIKSVKSENGFKDLQPLKSLIGSSKIVALGENTHGTSEIFKMKHRLIEFLSTEMGFTIFSIEASMAEAYRLNDYIIDGIGDPKILLEGMYFWTWNTQEVLDMIEWMRRYNESGKGRIQFTGFDMQSYSGALENLNDFFDKYDPNFKINIDSISNTIKNLSIKNKSIKANAVRARQILTKCDRTLLYLSKNKKLITERISIKEYNWLIQNVNLITQYVNMVNNPIMALTYRDQCMAENVKWIIENNPNSKLIIWAHNGHISREKGLMGNCLHKQFSDDYYNIGFLSNTGTYTAYTNGLLKSDNELSASKQGAFEYYFSQTNMPMFYFDFKQLIGAPNSRWIEKNLQHKNIGSVAGAPYVSSCKLSSLYNAILYIDNTTASECFSVKE